MFEGIVENGQIRLSGNVSLPENARVFVFISDAEAPNQARIRSPRLMHPEQAGDFVKQVIEMPADAQL